MRSHFSVSFWFFLIFLLFLSMGFIHVFSDAPSGLACKKNFGFISAAQAPLK